MELRGHRRANKPQSGLFSRHYFNGRVVLHEKSDIMEAPPIKRGACTTSVQRRHGMSDEVWHLLEPHLLRQRGQWERDCKR